MVAGRGQGKTQAIVNWLLEQPGERAVVVADGQRGQQIRNRLLDALYAHRMDTPRQLQLIDNMVVTIDYVLRSHGPLYARYRQIAIDDAEFVLSKMFGGQVELVTMNATLMPMAPQVHWKGRDYVDGDLVSEEPKGIDWSKLNPAGPDRFA